MGESQKEAEDTVRPAINAYYEMLGGSRPLGEWTKHGYLDIGETMSDHDDKLDWFGQNVMNIEKADQSRMLQGWK